jgi:hypothetical protein
MRSKANTINCLKAQKKFNDNIICATFSPACTTYQTSGVIFHSFVAYYDNC